MRAKTTSATASKSRLGFLPWAVLGVVSLYIMGYTDGSVHAAFMGDMGGRMDYVHEFFHHARHVALMCH